MTTEKPKIPKIKRLPRMTKEQIKEGLKQIPLDTLILGNQARTTTLTKKQRDFAKGVALGGTLSQTYRDTYNTKGKTSTVNVSACKLASTPNVSQMIEQFRTAQMFVDYHKPSQIRALAIEQLVSHALSESNPPNIKLRAIELLGKMSEVGLFVERKETRIIHESSTLKSNLLDKIKELMKDTKDDGSSLLEELTGTGITNSEQEDDDPHPPKTGGIDMAEYVHSTPLKQSPPPEVIDSKQENNVVALVPDDINYINNRSQVIDSKGV